MWARAQWIQHRIYSNFVCIEFWGMLIDLATTIFIWTLTNWLFIHRSHRFSNESPARQHWNNWYPDRLSHLDAAYASEINLVMSLSRFLHLTFSEDTHEAHWTRLSSWGCQIAFAWLVLQFFPKLEFKSNELCQNMLSWLYVSIVCLAPQCSFMGELCGRCSATDNSKVCRSLHPTSCFMLAIYFC